MTVVRIFRPSRSTMQAGLAATRRWLLEFPPAAPRTPDPLMGWASERDTERQVRLSFPTLALALDYARRHALAAEVEGRHERQFRPKSYAENFTAGRAEPWSH